MALNKFTSSDIKKEWMNINCSDVVATQVTCDKLNAGTINGLSTYGVKSVQLTDISFSNTTAEEQLAIESELSSNELEVGDFASYRIEGLISNVATGTLKLKLYGGPTASKLLFDFVIPPRPVATSKSFKLECDITVRSANTILISASFLQTNDTGTFSDIFSSTNIGAFDIAEANNLKWTAQFSVLSAGNALTSRQASLRF